jgi:hypothetical protein
MSRRKNLRPCSFSGFLHLPPRLLYFRVVAQLHAGYDTLLRAIVAAQTKLTLRADRNWREPGSRPIMREQRGIEAWW